MQTNQDGREKPKHYHLIGICGTAMASLAGMLVAKGHQVTGSDENVYPPMSTELQKLGIPVFQGYSAENLGGPPDTIVVGNAITRGNRELESVLDRGLYYTSMPLVIQEHFLRGRHSVVVAGTHGKTTTTSLMAWVMYCAGVNPSFLIGGVAENFNSSFKVTDGDYFVVEGDEYDTAYFDKGPKFMHYLPRTVILNNIEFDHADIYRDIEAIEFAFSRLINLVPGRGCLVAGWDSPIVRKVSQRAFCPVESFGLEPGAKWTATDVDFSGEMTSFEVATAGRPFGSYRTRLVGEFNIRNCLGAIAASESLGLNAGTVREALAEFKSVKRRMQVRGVIRDITVIDDFAHHPTAVRETLTAARSRYPSRRIVAVFEPRSYTAQLKIFQKDFEDSLSAADSVIVAGLFHPERYGEQTGASPEDMAANLKARGHEARYIASADAIVQHLAHELRPNDVVVIMSNGSFGGIHEKLIAALETGKDSPE
jgi:UDP-N-acetylmuramate: L-alanyl-gamma-D-glutamyl-meso-diaminopimelate ligase